MDMQSLVDALEQLNRYGVVQFASSVLIILCVIIIIRLAVGIRRSLRYMDDKQDELNKKQADMQMFEQRLRVYTRLVTYCDDIRKYRGLPEEDFRLPRLQEVVIQAEAFYDRNSVDKLKELYDKVSLEARNMASYVMSGNRSKWNYTINEIWGLMDTVRNDLYVKYIDLSDD